MMPLRWTHKNNRPSDRQTDKHNTQTEIVINVNSISKQASERHYRQLQLSAICQLVSEYTTFLVFVVAVVVAIFIQFSLARSRLAGWLQPIWP